MYPWPNFILLLETVDHPGTSGILILTYTHLGHLGYYIGRITDELGHSTTVIRFHMEYGNSSTLGWILEQGSTKIPCIPLSSWSLDLISI